MTVRGLSNNHNPDVKNLFKGAAISARTHPGPLYTMHSPEKKDSDHLAIAEGSLFTPS